MFLERPAGHSRVHVQVLLKAGIGSSRKSSEKAILQWGPVGKQANRRCGWGGHGVSSERT
jgi:hypothetical protein